MTSALQFFCVLWLGLALTAAQATFAVAVTPPRFELLAQPGQRLRHVIEITNAAAASTTLLLRTADWELLPNESVLFRDALQPRSCRPWVAIERREVILAARQVYRYRFEVTVPPDTPPIECRFALMLEGKEAEAITGSGDSPGSPPVSGRIGVIVYVAVGGAAPELSVRGARLENRQKQPTIVLDVVNNGSAHGRLEGFLTATDAAGRSYDAAAATTPILPGERRGIAVILTPKGEPQNEARPEFPVTLKGKLEWGKGRTTAIEYRVDR